MEGEIDIVQIEEDTSIRCKFESNENIPLILKTIRTNRQKSDRETTHFKWRQNTDVIL